MDSVNVVVLLLVCCSLSDVGGDDFRVGVLTTGEMGLPFQMYSSAINIAVDNFMEEGWLQGNTVRLFYRNDLCDPKVGAGLAVEMTMEENATALLGSYCSNVSISVGYFIAWSNTALLSHSSTDPELRNKDTFSTIIRVKPSFGKLGGAVIALFRHYQWSRVVMIITKNGYCESGGEAIQGAIQGVGREITLSDYIRANQHFSNVETEDYLDRIKARSRVVLMCGDTEDKHHILVRAHERGMVAPEYTYIFFDMLPNDHDDTYQPWTTLNLDNPDNAALTEMYRTVKQLTMSEITGDAIQRFYESVPVKLQDKPWQSDQALNDGWKINKDALFLHDLTKLWLLILNETLAEGGDPRNGTNIFEKSRNKTFSGLTGEVIMDDRADRDPQFWLWTLNPGDSSFHPGIKITMSKPENERVEIAEVISWGTEDGLAPPAVPLCGFFNEFCPQDNSVRNASIIGGSVGGLLVIISIVVWVLIYKRKQLEHELSAMLWKVRFEDIQLTKQRAGSVIGLSMKSMKSIRSRGSNMSDRAETVQKNSDQVFAEMGLFKGNMIAVKRVNVPEVIPDRQDLLDFKTMTMES